MARLWSLSSIVCVCLLFANAAHGQWGQWRGPSRDGVLPQSPPLLDGLPEAGIQPLWVTDQRIPGGGNGGWASPIVDQRRVYQLAHWRDRRPEVELPPEQYPALSEEQERSMSEQEVRQYEALRRDERLERRKKQFDHFETIYCLDADSGELLWSFERESVATNFSHSCTPVLDEGRLYWHGADRMVVCVDAQHGELVWQSPLPVELDGDQVPSSPVVVGDLLVVLVGQLFGIDTASGELRWSGDPERTKGTHSSPVVWRRGGGDDDAAVVIVNVQGGQTIGVDSASGELLWEVDSKAIRSTPLVVGDRLLTYGHSRGAGLRCFDLSSAGEPQELWAFRGAADSGSSPVVVAGHAFVQGEGRLACVDLQTGRGRWQTLLDLDRPRYTSLVAADDKVIYAFDGVLCFSASADKFQSLFAAKADESGLLHSEAYFREQLGMDELERTAEGQKEALQRWQRQISRQGPLSCASPAVVDGRLYVRLNQGLACYDLRASGAAAGGSTAGAAL